ncbi:MAG TPA: PIN domain-containing protein [Burkholderiaceae bacterium]|nr:PIN domain-containing protein [Burkholderiaceae bacterium]
MNQAPQQPLTSQVPSAVLDTNVVLDWLVFHDPRCAALMRAIAAGELRWVATEAMREELAHVLHGGTLDRWAPDVAAVHAAWDRHCDTRPEPPAAPLAGWPRCRDRDDQKFIDLALAGPARWLFSRDRAVLRLARRLGAAGVEVTTPEHFAPSVPAAA